MNDLLTLAEWAHEYARHRYRARGVPYDLKEKVSPFEFVISTQVKTEGYLIADVLETITPPKSEGSIVIITKNTQENVDTLAKNWDVFAKCEKLWIVFANPRSVQEKQWSIHPHLHSQ